MLQNCVIYYHSISDESILELPNNKNQTEQLIQVIVSYKT